MGGALCLCLYSRLARKKNPPKKNNKKECLNPISQLTLPFLFSIPNQSTIHNFPRSIIDNRQSIYHINVCLSFWNGEERKKKAEKAESRDDIPDFGI